MKSSDFLETILPLYDARERHEVMVRRPAATVWAALERTEFSRLLAVRVLMALRTLPFLLRAPSAVSRPPRAPLVGARSLTAAGFSVVDERPGRQIVLGVQGDFWRPRPNVRPLALAEALSAPPDGTAYALWSFLVEPVGDATRLVTETRIKVGDERSRRRFLAYWAVIRPFSGLIRLRVLQAVRREAERGTPRIDSDG